MLILHCTNFWLLLFHCFLHPKNSPKNFRQGLKLMKQKARNWNWWWIYFSDGTGNIWKDDVLPRVRSFNPWKNSLKLKAKASENKALKLHKNIHENSNKRGEFSGVKNSPLLRFREGNKPENLKTSGCFTVLLDPLEGDGFLSMVAIMDTGAYTILEEMRRCSMARK